MTKRKNDDDVNETPERDPDMPDAPADDAPLTVTEHDDLEAQAQARKDEAAQRGRPE